jgi:hypothetical protein
MRHASLARPCWWVVAGGGAAGLSSFLILGRFLEPSVALFGWHTICQVLVIEFDESYFQRFA